MKKLLASFFIFAASLILADVTIPAGNVNGLWTSSQSPYFIDGDITIQFADNLIIEPGVEVIFNGYYKLNVNGRITAEGTISDSILFTVADTTGFYSHYEPVGAWRGLRFSSGNYNGQENSILKHCRIQYAKSMSGWNIPYAEKRGGAIYVNLTSNLEVSHCKIANNVAGYGAGIYCWSSSPALSDLIIMNNFAYGDGGGVLFCGTATHPTMENSHISENSCYNNGGGIYCSSGAAPTLNSIVINGNNAIGGDEESGGGISCWGSNLTLNNVTISENTSRCGGGLECSLDSNIIFTNGNICGNFAYRDGGGIYNGSTLSLSGVTISENSAEDNGGGIVFINNSETLFDSENRCNIFSNTSEFNYSGLDLYSDSNVKVDVIVDTFTVLYPDNFYTYPLNNFSFDIQNCKFEQTFADLYVNPSGSNTNSGLNANEPLKTISYAMSKIAGSNNESHTIYLDDGTYSPFETGEQFPIRCKSFINIVGNGSEVTILNAQNGSRLLDCFDSDAHISGITLQNGYSDIGGGIYFYNSSCEITNVTIQNCNGYYSGGGIYTYHDNSKITNCKVINNISNCGGGIMCRYSTLQVLSTEIRNNIADDDGGGLYLYEAEPLIEKTLIADNEGNHGGGLFIERSSPMLINNTITGNNSYWGSGLYCHRSNTILNSSIVWNNQPLEIFLNDPGNYFDNTIDISYSDIQEGETGINNSNSTINWLDGNFDQDPCFIDSLNGEFALTENSPCIDAGNPYFAPDPDGSRSDIGAYYHHHAGGIEVWANFQIENEYICMNETVYFSDLSTAFNTQITTWKWDFQNDGIIDSYLQNPIHSYPDTGFYSISLTVENGSGATNTMLKEQHIAVHAPYYAGNRFHIDPAGSDELGNGSLAYPFTTIQHGIMESSSADTVLVFPGTYVENINFMGRAVTLGSLYFLTQDSTYISNTIIDGNDNGSTIYAAGGLDSTLVISGFTILNGSDSGIKCNHASPRIENCIISQNSAEDGGGIFLSDSKAILSNLVIINNFASEDGGGLFACAPFAQLTNVQIIDNEAANNGGGINCSVYSPFMDNVVVNSNTAYGNGGGIYFNRCNKDFIGLEITSNHADEKGGGIYFYIAEVEMSNFTISDNTASFGGGVYCLSSSVGSDSSIHWHNTPNEVEFYQLEDENYIEISFCDFSNGTGGIVTNNNGIVNWLDGNIDIDPQFTDPQQFDYTLMIDSPCIDQGNPYWQIDPDSTRLDMGSHFYFHETGNSEVWANISAMSNTLSLGENLLFTDLSVDFFTDITSWQWDFDSDGSIDSYIVNPIYCYPDTGFYSVTLTVADDIGNSNSMTKEDFIMVTAPGYNGNVYHIDITGSNELGNGSLMYPFASIQLGIDTAANCDTILVHPGIYYENIVCDSSYIVIGSQFLTTCDSSYIATTIIDGDGSGTVVTLQNIKDSTSVFCGFTVRNGSEGGILCYNSDLMIHHNILENNTTSTFGAGIKITDNSYPRLYNLLIHSNHSDGAGGGLAAAVHSSPLINNITLANNIADTYGGGMITYLYSNPIILNSIIWDNQPDQIFAYSDSVTVAFSDIQDSFNGEGNIDAYPFFIDPGNNNFQFSAESPCIDSGTIFFEWNGEVIVNLNEDDYNGLSADMGYWESNYLFMNSDNPITPLTFNISKNFPNPFNPDTKIQFSIPVEADVELAIYNVKGQKVNLLISDKLVSGHHQAVWNGKDNTGKQASSGIYFYKVKASVKGKTKFEKIRKMMLLK